MCVTVIASPKIYFQNFVSCDLMVNYQTLQQPVTYQNADFKVKLQWQELQWLLRAKHLLLTMYQNRIEKKKISNATSQRVFYLSQWKPRSFACGKGIMFFHKLSLRSDFTGVFSWCANSSHNWYFFSVVIRVWINVFFFWHCLIICFRVLMKTYN